MTAYARPPRKGLERERAKRRTQRDALLFLLSYLAVRHAVGVELLEVHDVDLQSTPVVVVVLQLLLVLVPLGAVKRAAGGQHVQADGGGLGGELFHHALTADRRVGTDHLRHARREHWTRVLRHRSAALHVRLVVAPVLVDLEHPHLVALHVVFPALQIRLEAADAGAGEFLQLDRLAPGVGGLRLVFDSLAAIFFAFAFAIAVSAPESFQVSPKHGLPARLVAGARDHASDGIPAAQFTVALSAARGSGARPEAEVLGRREAHFELALAARGVPVPRGDVALHSLTRIVLLCVQRRIERDVCGAGVVGGDVEGGGGGGGGAGEVVHID